MGTKNQTEQNQTKKNNQTDNQKSLELRSKSQEEAIQKAIETGADEILMIGGTGTRLDHVLGNFGQLFYAHSKGVKAELVDANNRIRVLNHEDTISKKDQFGKYVSLIPIYEARGVTLTGFKYPLKDHTLVFEQSLAISNELEAEEGIISFSEGKLLLIESRD